MPGNESRVEIPLDRGRLLAGVGMALTATVGAGSVLTVLWASGPTGAREVGAVVALLVATAGGLTGLVTTTLLAARRGPGLEIAASGIVDRTRLVSFGVLRWPDVTWHRVEGSGAVIIDVDPAAAARRQASSTPMRVLRLRPHAMAFDNLDVGHDEIARVLQRFAADRHHPSIAVRADVIGTATTSGREVFALQPSSVPTIGWRHRWLGAGCLAVVAGGAAAGTALIDKVAPELARHLSPVTGAVVLGCVLLLLAELARVGRLLAQAFRGEEVGADTAVVGQVVHADGGERVDRWLPAATANELALTLAAGGHRVAARYHPLAVVHWGLVRVVGASLAAAGVLLFAEVSERAPDWLALVLLVAGVFVALVGPRVPAWALRGRGRPPGQPFDGAPSRRKSLRPGARES